MSNNVMRNKRQRKVINKDQTQIKEGEINLTNRQVPIVKECKIRTN